MHAVYIYALNTMLKFPISDDRFRIEGIRSVLCIDSI